MIVKLIAPGILPNDYVTVDLQGVPNRGDTVLVKFPTDDGRDEAELLTVLGVTWPVEIMPGILHHAVASLPEVTLERTPDATYTVDVINICNTCNVNIYRDSRGQEFKAGRCEHFPHIPPVESILERN